MELERNTHHIYRIMYHFVWIPKYRNAIFKKPYAEYLKALFRKIAYDYDMEVSEIEIVEDHIHMMLKAPPSAGFFPSIADGHVRDLVRRADDLRIPEIWRKIRENSSLQDELVLEHTYNSTAIEGTTFTLRKTEAVLFSQTIIPKKSLIAHLEVTNHAAVLKAFLQTPARDRPISISHKYHIHNHITDSEVYRLRGLPSFHRRPKDQKELDRRGRKSRCRIHTLHCFETDPRSHAFEAISNRGSPYY